MVTGEGGRERAYSELRGQLQADGQAYVVCPLVEEARDKAPRPRSPCSGELFRSPPLKPPGPGTRALRAATAELRRLRQGELKGYELVLLHGGMRTREKQEAMAAFASGKADVLVATTVIEVGIDVPNATVMLIENAERFGISQLHQLRSESAVANIARAASCSARPTPRARRGCARWSSTPTAFAWRRSTSPCARRGAGRNPPIRFGQFQMACLPEDAETLERARAWAEAIVAADPELRTPEHALLGQALERKFGVEALEPIPA